MKKILILLGSLLISAQFVCAKRLYIEMQYKNNSIKIDDGTNKKSQTIKGTDGKDLKFKSLIGALNYMSFQGWDLIETKPIVSGRGSILGGTSSTDTKVYYIFSKDVSDEELKKIIEDSYKIN